MRFLIRGFAAALTFFILAPGAARAAFPDHPITLIVPYAAGGPMDRLARQLAAKLNLQLNQPIVILNRGGAGGNIGAVSAKHAAPDGYMLFLDHIHMATAPSLERKLDFNPLGDFTPLGIFVESPLVLIARPGIPVDNKDDFLRWMASQAQVSMANAGTGSASFLCSSLLQSGLKKHITMVPYRGTGPAMIDLLSGQVDLMCDLTANAIPQVQAGKVKAIAVTVPQPLIGTALATTPTMQDFGIPVAPLTVWYGLYAPAKTPDSVVRKISEALRTVVKDPEFRKEQADAGLKVITDERLAPEGHRDFLEAEIKRWGSVIQEPGN
uniref:tripartite tricarboxylate transporter substrate-binding protein n=1 Tax=Bordetella sputigena TaxID=1416810 RepID=UPI0039EE6AE0